MPDLYVVYVLTNPAMPGLVKIGHTTQSDVETRMGQLYGTGVPFPFTLEFACRVPNPDEVEKALHIAFAPNRVNARREFFQIDPGQAIAIMKLLHVEDATAEFTGATTPAATGVSAEEQRAGEEYRARRPRLNFLQMDIPLGSTLVSTSSDATVTVSGERKVRLGEDELSLTAATRRVLGIDYNVAPGPYWRFNGKLLQDIYEETYGNEE